MPPKADGGSRIKHSEKPIEGYRGRYNLGFRADGQPYVVNTETNRILKTFVQPYVKVRLVKPGEKEQKTHLLHILVAQTHLSYKPANATVVHHISGDVSDNSAKNLSWVSASANARQRLNVKGYTLLKSGRFRTVVGGPDNKQHAAGTFDTAAAAQEAYKKKYAELWGQRRRLPLAPIT